MKLGVGSYAFRWSLGFKDRVPEHAMRLVELIDRVADLGAEVLQVADNAPLHRLSVEELRELAERAGERGVALEVGTDGASDDNLVRYLGIARELDAQVVRLTLDRQDLAEPRHILVGRLRRFGDRYADACAVLAIENHFLVATEELVRLFGEVDHPGVGACLDVANSIATQEWPFETVDKLAPYALNLHLKDYRIEIDAYGVGMHVTGVPLGGGIVDVDAVLASLRAAGRNPSVILEHWLPYEVASAGGSLVDVEAEWTAKSLEEARRRIAG